MNIIFSNKKHKRIKEISQTWKLPSFKKNNLKTSYKERNKILS